MKLKYRIRHIIFAAAAAALFSAWMFGYLTRTVSFQEQQKMTISDEWFCGEFYSEEMREKRETMSSECKTFLGNVEKEAVYFPVPESSVDNSLKVSYIDSWGAERTYSGKRSHEGTDIMALRNERGVYPVVSICDGTVTNIGWLEKGGYRIGVTSDSGTYYYYAHMDSYANLKEGDKVRAGEFLGYMGDSGYGKEGTVGKFDVHLHMGIYFYKDGKEISVNPYYLLKALEKKKLTYEFR